MWKTVHVADLQGCWNFVLGEIDKYSIRILLSQAHSTPNYENKIVSIANVNLSLDKKKKYNQQYSEER